LKSGAVKKIKKIRQKPAKKRNNIFLKRLAKVLAARVY